MKKMKVTDFVVGQTIISKLDNKEYTIIEIDTTILNGIIVQGDGCGLCFMPEEVIVTTKENLTELYLSMINEYEIKINKLKDKIKKLKK